MTTFTDSMRPTSASNIEFIMDGDIHYLHGDELSWEGLTLPFQLLEDGILCNGPFPRPTIALEKGVRIEEDDDDEDTNVNTAFHEQRLIYFLLGWQVKN